ncbi:MAG: Replicative DNA helicase [Parcubacteria bacterium 32_520]|nr:MAG: Replicative DNA helicase [Parcubacteria bacterium 32_520]
MTNMIPKNIEVERAILGAMLNDPEDAHIGIEHLAVKDFYITKHQIIFSGMRALIKEEKNIDLVNIQYILTKKKKLNEVEVSYITDLMNTVPVTYKAIDYCNILKQTTYQREVYILLEQYKEGKIEFQDLTAKILDYPPLEKKADEQTLKELFLATLKRSSEGVAYKFNLEELNYYLGGVDYGETIVIGGYTSQGKTMLALQLAIDFAEQGLNILYCSSEMTPLETARRILSNRTDANIMEFRRGNIDKETEDKIRQASIALGDVWKINIRTVLYTSDINFLIKKYNPDIIFVDHLQNMDTRERGLSDYQRVTNNMKDLQAMALENRKVVFVLSQLKRRKEDDKLAAPKLSDLRDSGAIEEKSNMVIFVYWKKRLQEEVNPRKGGEPPEEIEIIVSKNRDGVIGRCKLDFYPEYCRIENSSDYKKEREKECQNNINQYQMKLQ